MTKQILSLKEELSIEELTNIILGGESETVEFKETYAVHFAKYCNTVAAFSNCKGGYLIFGVKDDGQIVGVPRNEKQRKNIINFITGNVKPNVNLETYLIEATTGEFLFVIKVNADPFNLNTSGNVPYKRIDSQNQPMDPADIERYFRKTTEIKKTAIVSTGKVSVVSHRKEHTLKKKGSLNEVSTILFKIRPYLNRLGYKTNEDLDFGEPAIENGNLIGFTDIRVKFQNNPAFVIEVKRDNAKLTNVHIEQGLKYGRALNLSFIALTNGLEFQLYNTKTGRRLSLNGQFFNVIPYKKDLEIVLKYLKTNPTSNNVEISNRPQVYKKGVNKNELLKIFKKCHNAIRDIEKDDEHAFSDFSKILFLKLLEEKSEAESGDTNGFKLPRGWYYFDELRSNARADQVMQNIRTMFLSIQEDPKYGEIFHGDIFYADKEATYKYIVDELAKISFQDSEIDAKGSAFEYFCKFNLKGSKLGQYFTPREVVNLMIELTDITSLTFALSDQNDIPKIIDPSCGTGGFLMQGMQRLIEEVCKLSLPKNREEKLIETIKSKMFWGCDANPTIARAAKMNMVIAGDGSTNIRKGDSLTEEIDFLQIGKSSKPIADIILANPPFGMSENRLSQETMRLYDLPTTKGQALFIQKMIKLTKPTGRICTVIDEGILNNPNMENIRKYIIKTCSVDAIISLPMVTFRPNYTNVKTSVLLLTKKKSELERQDKPVFMCDLKQIGYDSVYQPTKITSSEINGDILQEYKLFTKGESTILDNPKKSEKVFIDDDIKLCFAVSIDEIENNFKFRMDARYNNPKTVAFINRLKKSKAVPLKKILLEDIYRGRTPKYEEDGVPVIKVRNITPYGLDWNTDFVSEDFYKRLEISGKIAQKGDVLIASTGVGSLGKICYFDKDTSCAIDGHISVVRIDNKKIMPEFLVAYLWSHYGQKQIERLYSGSTGQIEIYEEDLNEILVVIPNSFTQKKLTKSLSESRKRVELLKKEMAEIQRKTFLGFNKLVCI